MRRLHELVDTRPGDALAIVDIDGTRLTYSDMQQAGAGIAGMLSAHGVRAGDRVILLAENCAVYVAAILALSRLSAWIVPLNARASAQEVDHVIAHSGARCVLATTAASPAALAHVKRLGATSIGKTVAGEAVVSPVVEVEVEPVTDSADQVAALLYTSGTSGAPKGVMLTHENLLASATSGVKARGIRPTDQMLLVLPGTHVYAFSGAFLGMFTAGGSIRFLPRFDPALVLQAFQQDVTLFPAVPQMYALILKHCREHGIQEMKTGLRYMSSGGSPLDPGWKKMIEHIFKLPMHNGYGLTEASPGVAATRMENPPKDECVGPPMPGIEVKLRNRNDENIGELLVRGKNIMKGYYKNPGATAEAMTEDGFLCTGDLARIEEDGSIYIVGRCKELIIHSGFNVYPPEVEAALNAHPAVVQAAVVGRERDGNEDVLAFVTLRTQATSDDLKAFLSEKLVGYKVPHHIVIVSELPQAATGKILKNKLAETFAGELKTLDGIQFA
ncbi:class I adenylate-forming enzyme family protein [Roseibium sp. RKSG952]|uniref:class I adenylate-forming enzyme family protein n=1 Tax=Roseibium sp. RKSG952 TaxID=2529384 RepID=UPI0012BD325C|nr:AMP-binding protein [Roseibium sp. RKSG952]MTI00428.1 long-chain fatty acid--CoA ligase [Roseibium sp. RKSG952]